NRVLKTGAKKLSAAAKHFRPDEPRDVVDYHPRTGLALDVTSEAIRARFERDHIDAFISAVGYSRPLPGLKIQRIEALRLIEQTVDVQPQHSNQRPGRSGQTLETNIYPGVRPRGVLFHYVRQNAISRRQL